MDDDWGIAAWPVQVWLGDPADERGGDGGVKGVAASSRTAMPVLLASQCVLATTPKSAGDFGAGGEQGELRRCVWGPA